MAFRLVGTDNKAPAETQVGDLVITGGGIYEKTSTGSRFVSSLKDYIGADKTTSRRVVEDLYKTVTGVKGFEPIGMPKNTTPATVDANGIVTVTPPATTPAADSAAYDPSAYMSQGSGSGLSGSKIAGYAIIGLVGLAVLDRFVGGSGK